MLLSVVQKEKEIEIITKRKGAKGAKSPKNRGGGKQTAAATRKSKRGNSNSDSSTTSIQEQENEKEREKEKSDQSLERQFQHQLHTISGVLIDYFCALIKLDAKHNEFNLLKQLFYETPIKAVVKDIVDAMVCI